MRWIFVGILFVVVLPGYGQGELVGNILDKAADYLSYEPDSSLIYAQQALELAILEEHDAAEARAHLYLGQISAGFGAYPNAVEHYLAANDLFEMLDDPLGLTQTHNALGDLYYYTRQISESLDQHMFALDIARKHGFAEEEALTLGYIGHFHEKNEDYSKALEYQNLALQAYQSLEDAQGLSTIYGHLGSIYEDLAEQDQDPALFDKAFDYFSRALEYNLRTNNEEQRIIHLNNLGDVFRKQGQYDEALRYTRQAYELAIRLDNLYQVKSALRDLAQTYMGTGRPDLAYAALDSAYEINEDLYDGESVIQIARMQSLHEITEAQQELELLKQRRKIDRLTQVSLGGGIFLTLLFGLLAFRQQRIKNRQERDLLKAQQELTMRKLENSQLHEQQLQLELETNSNELSTHALSIVQKNKVLKDIKSRLSHLHTSDKSLKQQIDDLIKKIDEGFHFEKDWSKFTSIFDQVHPSFLRTLHERFPHLTSAEIRLCALLRLNLDSKDIATILGISHDSLRVSRYRLRKSLGLKKGENLTAFVMKI